MRFDVFHQSTATPTRSASSEAKAVISTTQAAISFGVPLAMTAPAKVIPTTMPTVAAVAMTDTKTLTTQTNAVPATATAPVVVLSKSGAWKTAPVKWFWAYIGLIGLAIIAL
ncbi:hypothetical protein M427DRAFT_58812 [Gonapodya prolifera JEL478]|uniref:Uncharacterized protein n=1 Tax=Gonapodya prolifera (strain JEL478) TaxID=1344416 RepID=A0A139A9C2_GONPJ|nr:hypothetical protein M427DRAFT_58812 [Gonapodya prolifera JEL478]|eukprot:KXS13268.1 hypothetical protein M427DRAFT_58812 [Gonapodya prolifera JEL478]